MIIFLYISLLPTTFYVLFLSTPFITCQDFRPLTEDVAFQATCRVQFFVENQADSVSEIYEHYQSNLASSNVVLRRKIDGTGSEITSRQFLFNGDTKKDVELLLPSTNQLYENRKSRSVKVLDKLDDALDSIIFKFEKLNAQNFTVNLDSFLTNSCKEKIDQKLYYIRGISRLLHVLECRRAEFKANLHPSTTRGIRTSVFSATNLPARSSLENTSFKVQQVEFLNVTVSIELTEKNSILPSRAIPLSLSLEFSIPNSSSSVTVIINFFQFEVDSSSELLEESNINSIGDSSLFLMPLALGLDNKLSSTRLFKRRRKFPTSFSFKASLTSDHLQLGNSEPVELVVAYDTDLRMVARQISLLDQSEVIGDSYKRHTTRLVHDYESGYKFHIKHSNNDYFNNQFENIREKSIQSWHTCESDIISEYEMTRLTTAGGCSAFDLDKAVYMGQTQVRGIPCNVYELRMFSLPLWLGFGEHEVAYHLSESYEIHTIIYELAQTIKNQNLNAQQEDRQADELTGKIVQLDINLLSSASLLSKFHNYSTKNDTKEILLSYQLKMHQFQWHVEEEMEGLFDIGQDCLFTSLQARYLEMELQMEPSHKDNNVSKLLYLLNQDNYLRNLAMSRALSDTFYITRSQQVNLEATIQPASRLKAKLKVYELPQSRLNVQFLGYALDESLGSASLSSWSIGSTDISLQECKWRAAHTLKHPTSIQSESKESEIIFMFCPKSLHCVLGDESWLSRSGKISSQQTIFKYPVSSSEPNRCTLMKVSREQQIGSVTKETHGRKHLDWLLHSRSRLIKESVEFKVPLSATSLSDPMIGTEELNWMSMHILKLTFSRIVSVYGSTDQGLVMPLHGVGYQTDNENNLLRVFSVVECSHLCMMLHQCASYSVCHHGSELQCSLTRINWTDSIQANELRRLVSDRKLSKSIMKSVQVYLEDVPGLATVNLRLSNLCSIYVRNQLDIFNLKDSSLEENVASEYLLHADSTRECARFCLERASVFQLIKQRNIKSGSINQNQISRQDKDTERFWGNDDDSPDSCSSFKFCEEKKICELLPLYSLTGILTFSGKGEGEGHANNMQSLGYNSSFDQDTLKQQQVAKWLVGIKKLRERSRDLCRFDELETYELNYIQLFNAYSGIHLINLNQEEENAKSSVTPRVEHIGWQMRIPKTDVEKCAKLCFEQRNCRSFDTLTEENQLEVYDERREQDFIEFRGSATCILNSMAVADINSSKQRDKLPFRIESRVNNSRSWDEQQEQQELLISNRWRHYEPSELALYLMSESTDFRSFECRRADGNTNTSSSGLFIRLDLDLVSIMARGDCQKI